MGLFDGIFGGFEKLEQRGDAALGRERALEALQLFQDAQRKAQSKDPVAAERLKAKVSRARRGFLAEKTQQAERLLEDELLEEALEELQVAAQYLTPEDREARLRIESLEQNTRTRLAAHGPGDVDLSAGAGLPAGAVGQAGAGAGAQEPAPVDDPEIDALFDQFAGALPPQDRDRAREAPAAFKRGFVAHQMGAADEAEAALRSAAQERPDDGLVRETLALVLDMRGKTEEAAAFYRSALEQEPDRTNARVALAGIAAGVQATAGIQSFAHWRQTAQETDAETSRPDEGLALLEEGIERDAEQTEAYLTAAAEICLAAGRATDAARYAQRVLDAGTPNAAMVHHLRAVAAELSGDLDRAESSFEEAVKLGGQALFFRAEYAEFALRHGRALKDAEQYIFDTCMGCQASQPSPEELDYYGFLLTRLQHARGELQEALKGIDRLLKKGPPPMLEGPLRELRRRVVGQMEADARPEA